MQLAGAAVARKVVGLFYGGASGEQKLQNFKLVAMSGKNDRRYVGGVISRLLGNDLEN